MKNVPIKFRGQTDGGDYVYGYYVPWNRESNQGIFSLKVIDAGYAGILTDGGELVAVKADSICQLLFRDDNGKERYFGAEKILERIEQYDEALVNLADDFAESFSDPDCNFCPAKSVCHTKFTCGELIASVYLENVAKDWDWR